VSVRRIDKLIGYVMWVSIAISLLVLGMVARQHLYRWDWRYTVALCLLWLPPALSLGQLDDTPGPQSPWFYRFAILTLLWGAAVGAYGFFLFDLQD
jgi:hypothetical protein